MSNNYDTQEHEPPAQEHETQEPIVKAPDNKNKIRIIAAIGIVVIAVIFTIVTNLNDRDYIAIVREFAPLVEEMGITATYGDVFERYIDSLDWSVSEGAENENIVIASGMIRGLDETISISISVTPYGGDHRTRVWIQPSSVELGNNMMDNPEHAAALLLFLFAAYNEGYEYMPWNYAMDGEALAGFLLNTVLSPAQ